MLPYLLTAALFLGLAGVIAADSSLVNFGLFESFTGLRWVRIHLITLGAIAETIFGVVPVVLQRHPVRKVNWNEWFLLTGGIVVLAIGIPILNQPLTVTGAGLVIAATVLLIGRIRKAERTNGEPEWTPFYATGFAFLIVGATVGAAMWVGWSDALAISVPIEVHIHANSWGFLSLVFAGLIFDRFEVWTGSPLVIARSRRAIFFLMALGALGLTLGPWLGSRVVLVPGLVAHLAATIWLVYGLIRSVGDSTEGWRHPGSWHLVSSYFWLIAPVLVAPLILFETPGFPGAGIEANAPQALIYGWALQLGIAVIPAVFVRSSKPRLGGNWFSLVAIHLGCALLWAGIFIEPQTTFHGAAYALWTVAIIPPAMRIGRMAARAA